MNKSPKNDRVLFIFDRVGMLRPHNMDFLIIAWTDKRVIMRPCEQPTEEKSVSNHIRHLDNRKKSYEICQNERGCLSYPDFFQED